MKRIKIFKAYFVLWTFVYFIAYSNKETFIEYFMSTLTFNIVIFTILGIGTFMLFKASKDITMLAGTFGVLMYKKNNLSFYLRGLEKILPSTIARRIQSRVEKNNLLFTQQEAEDLLAWMDEKFSNQNKYNNFFIGTVLMIGLLGTFAGLLGAIGSMSSIVASLAGDNIDIGKIMAGFSGPLSSMAVGFGSSLFGVISAIILSIKGYILNKSQASLIEGVENWLNSKILESIDNSIATTPVNDLEDGQKSFIDIFLETIDKLTQKINTLSNTNEMLKEELISTIMIENEKQNEKFDSITASNNNLVNSFNKLIEIELSQSNLLNKAQENQEINNKLLKELKTSSTITQMQFAEALSSLQNTLYKLNKENNNPKKSIEEKYPEEIDFLKKHFKLKSGAI